MKFSSILFIALSFLYSNPSYSQLVVFCGDELTVDNDTGVNNLEDYPERPGFAFSGTERVVQLPVSECGEVCFTVSNRTAFPGVSGNVDLFVLTDPNDSQSNILWLNGFGGTACFTAVPGQPLFLAFDGLGGSLASFDLEITCADDCEPDPILPEFVAVPTMGEWGVISLSLVLLIVGITGIRQKVNIKVA